MTLQTSVVLLLLTVGGYIMYKLGLVFGKKIILETEYFATLYTILKLTVGIAMAMQFFMLAAKITTDIINPASKELYILFSIFGVVIFSVFFGIGIARSSISKKHPKKTS